MDQGLYAMLREVGLQFITSFAEHGEGVIDIMNIGKAVRQGDQRVLNMVVIVVGNLLTMGIVLI